MLGSTPDVEYRGAGARLQRDVSNPKALNADLPTRRGPRPAWTANVYTRAPQVGYFRIWRTAIGVGALTDLYAITNHFSQHPDSRIGQRREQARYTALIVNALAADPDGARVVVGGDFNVYPRPGRRVVAGVGSDQLGPLYDLAGMTNLFSVLVEEIPSAAYSYVFQGQTQTLDGQFVTDLLLEELEQARAAHVNADFPADTPDDGPRGLSDHDPLVARYELPATLAGLRALVEYYADGGQIHGSNTEVQLLAFLTRAAAGGPSADAQLQAFIDHVEDKMPEFIDPVEAQALIDEAELLLG